MVIGLFEGCSRGRTCSYAAPEAVPSRSGAIARGLGLSALASGTLSCPEIEVEIFSHNLRRHLFDMVNLSAEVSKHLAGARADVAAGHGGSSWPGCANFRTPYYTHLEFVHWFTPIFRQNIRVCLALRRSARVTRSCYPNLTQR